MFKSWTPLAEVPFSIMGELQAKTLAQYIPCASSCQGFLKWIDHIFALRITSAPKLRCLDISIKSQSITARRNVSPLDTSNPTKVGLENKMAEAHQYHKRTSMNMLEVFKEKVIKSLKDI